MTCQFSSVFSGRLIGFIKQKNSVGFSYRSDMNNLRNFDQFCSERFPEATALTKELCMAWAVRRSTEGSNTFYNRLRPVREFAKYLNRLGEIAYILPSDMVKKSPRPIPHIYSEMEIASVWRVLDHIKRNKRYPIRHFVLPTLVRLLYCCGLRPCEARKLRVVDVDLEKGRLNIMESKCNRSRIVMMDDDVTELCRHYDESIATIMPQRELFFPNHKGSIYSQDWITKFYGTVRTEAGIATPGKKAPRLYDFRHTFATHRLYQWMREGKDVTAMLPYLSAYMGHAQLSDTYYYIHLVPGLFEKMAGFDYSSSDILLPEVECDE